MRKALEVTRIAVVTIKAFIEYQVFYRKSKDEL
jgi:hypothetical protein